MPTNLKIYLIWVNFLEKPNLSKLTWEETNNLQAHYILKKLNWLSKITSIRKLKNHMVRPIKHSVT